MPDLTSSATPGTWAEVHARDHVVRYRRSGSGGVIVLLGVGEGRALWPGLEETVGRIGRVMIPDLGDPTDQPVECRLAAFLEGIGATGVPVLVANQALVAPVLALALLEPELIGRVVVVADGVATGTPLDASLAGEQRPVPLPVLLLARDLPPGDAEPALVRFLRPVPGAGRS
jgi:hypothetical protein